MFQVLTTSEMQAFEKYACDHFDLTVDAMMQNAGRAVFELIVNELLPEAADHDPQLQGSRVLIVAGKGNNGGDALVAARLLKEAGVDAEILTPYPRDEFTEAAGREMERVKQLNMPMISSEGEIGQSRLQNVGYDLIVDGLFGFSLKGNPRPPADEIIRQMNASGVPVLSVDVPSGLEAETGRVMTPCVKATYTLTLGMPKIGLTEHKEQVGKLFLGSLGIPEKAYQKLGIYTPIFLGKTYIPLE